MSLRRRQIALCFGLSASCALLACESDSPSSPAARPDDEPGDHSGQTGSPGERECFQDSDCRAQAEKFAQWLREATQARPPFVRASCQNLSLISGGESRSGPTCMCATETGGAFPVGPKGADCQVRGRAGSCLWESFDGCNLDDPMSCTTICSELERRQAEDAAKQFSAEVFYSECRPEACRSVLSIEGRCVPINAIGSGRSYDCSLGGEAILDADRSMVAAMNAPAMSDPSAWQRPTPYVAGTRGFIELGVSLDSWGSFTRAPNFYAYAQFFDAQAGNAPVRGEVLDPLSGLDDCGVLHQSANAGIAVGDALPSFFPVTEATLSSADESYDVAATSANNQWFSSYAADLEHEPPHYGTSYKFAAQGGKLNAQISVAVRLPEALSVPSLENVGRLPRTSLSLAWTGKGSAPLRVLLRITANPDYSPESYEVECNLRDDGAFTIPADILTLVPDGFVEATITREARSVETSGSQKLLSLGTIQLRHRFVLGERCDSAALLAACKQLATKQDSAYAQCGAKPDELQVRCPDYLADSCSGCTRFYTCQEEQLRCSTQGLETGTLCGC